jgi:hypothetical protein
VLYYKANGRKEIKHMSPLGIPLGRSGGSGTASSGVSEGKISEEGERRSEGGIAM